MPLLIRQFKETRVVKTIAPSDEGLEPKQTYQCQTFPEFNLSLFYKAREIQNFNEEGNSLLKYLVTNEALAKMNEAEWAKYLQEIIYLLWYQIFCTALPMY